jgi:hypothetical protein
LGRLQIGADALDRSWPRLSPSPKVEDEPGIADDVTAETRRRDTPTSQKFLYLS